MLPPFPQGTISTFFPETPYFFLSNFYSHSVSYEGITYPSTEHAYQAAKTLDENLRLNIMRAPNAAAAKKMGNALELRRDWDDVRVGIMRELLEEKFKIGSPLAKKLKATGEVYLIEGNYWHDRFWGQCFCPKHKWEGENMLGNLLVERREAI